MAENFGNGVSRTLSAKDRQFSTVVWQKGKPPLDSELNLISQITQEFQDKLSEASTPSGWVGDPTRCVEDFVTNSAWSNFFKFGTQRDSEKRGFPIALVNGWVIPVTSTNVGDPPISPNNTDFSNRIELGIAPTGLATSQTDFVFLEVWRSQISPGGTTSKPTTDGIYKFGNTLFGGDNLSDDIEDPAIGFETTERVQTQYRIRVVPDTTLSGSNSGFDATVFSQGAASSVTSFTFSNMREELGDVGLWRSGDGNSGSALGTVDGYSYAIPICTVFRRNTQGYSSASNQNGSVNRGSVVANFINVPTLASDLSIDEAVSLTLVTDTNIGIPNAENKIRIDDEILIYATISGTSINTLTRGAEIPGHTKAQTHSAGTTIELLSMRPDGLFADQVAKKDILDMRHIISLEKIDYQHILSHNFMRLLKGDLKTTWKLSGTSGIRGSELNYTDRITTVSPSAGIIQLDGGDNHRIMFSDAAVLQPGNLCLVSPPVGTSEEQVSLSDFSIGIDAWATVNPGGGYGVGDHIRIPISQFQSGFLADSESVRFISSDEMETSVKIWVDGDETEYTATKVNGAGTFTNFTARGSVGGASPVVSDELIITFGSSWSATDQNLHISISLLYNPGLGLSHTPNYVHDIVSVGNIEGIVTRYFNKLHMEPIHLWGRVNPEGYREEHVKNSEAYVDLGSKTTVICPFRKVGYPDLKMITTTAMPVTGTGDDPKAETDPLSLFDKTQSVSIPMDWLSCPRIGDVFAPILHQTSDDFYFDQGINFFVGHKEDGDGSLSEHETNYVNTAGTDTQQFFSTTRDGSDVATYNRIVPSDGSTTGALIPHAVNQSLAGMQIYPHGVVDTQNREGLQLPPFYGVSRLWAIYEANDFIANGSSFSNLTREPLSTPNSTNLLRPDFDGAPIFIVEDDDGDSTFVLNAEAIDLNRLASPPSSFSEGQYVIEASVFGFDRDFLSDNCRVVLTTEAVVTSDMVLAPNFIVQAPIPPLSSMDITYSRTPYQGDVLGTNYLTVGNGTNHLDRLHRNGVMSSTNIRNVIDNPLSYGTLTLNNQKSFEVLAGYQFYTTLGSGTLSFPLSFYTGDIRVGAEDPTYFPPSTSGTAPPRTEITNGGNSIFYDGNFEIAKPSDLNMVDRLPLGSLFRDKDFMGQFLDRNNSKQNFMVSDMCLSHKALMELPYLSSFMGEGENTLGHEYSDFDGVGSYITLVDGIVNDLSNTTNFKTERGGSAYVSSKPIPGGMIESYLGNFDLSTYPSFHSSIMFGVALLVRSFPEQVSGEEVMAGDELQMVVITQAFKPSMVDSEPEISLAHSTTGSGEGYTAVDRFRLSGYPLVSNRTRYEPDTSAITLAKKV